MTYRLAADKEVKYLVEQKSNDDRWNLHSYTIGMDPRSRFFDPTDIDCPPMPYDDPAAHRYMHCVAGKKGYPCWHMGGDWYGLENPRWRELLTKYNEVNQEGAIKLTMNGSVCLAQVHSDPYRTQIETIYLSALDVSTTRYQFDVQFFGDSSTVFNHTGQLRTPPNERNTLTVGAVSPDSTLRVRKQFATGGELIVGFANTLVWQFAGQDTSPSTGLLNFSFVQPLLRGGGRVVALETLTIVERNLLYNLRAFQRFRQGFYTTITVGNGSAGAVQNLVRRGGFLGGTGLTGFTGTGAGGIGGVAAGSFGIGAGGAGGGAGGGGTGLGFVGGGAGQVGGFLGILQLIQNVRLIQSNLDALVRTLGLLEANLDAGLIDVVQVDNFRQNIETQRAALLSAQVNLQTSIDQYNMLIDLPPNIPLDFDDTLLRQFEFVDPRTVAVQHMIEDFVNVAGDLPDPPGMQDLTSALDTLAELRTRLADQFQSAHTDIEKLDTASAERKKTMTPQQAIEFDRERVKLADGLSDVENRFGQTEGLRQSLVDNLSTEEPSKTLDEIVALGTGLSGLTQELALVKARARLETATIPKVDLNSERALDIARGNRLDWMNNRASLVDQWRLISFAANALRAGLDLTFNGSLGTVGNNSVAFNGQNGAMSVGVRFDSPFTRRSERNTYRQNLIQYQQQRRQLYLYQDQANFGLRVLLRTLSQLETNLEIQRRAVVIAIRRVDKTREDLNKPPAPVQPGQQVETLGPTVAQNLITALNDLQAAQNNFVSVVLNHYMNRMLLYRELGIMELDDCGMWIDKPINEAEWLTEDDCPMPPPVPAEWMADAGVTAKDIEDYAAKQDSESALEADPALAADADIADGLGKMRRGHEGAAAPTKLRQAQRLSRPTSLSLDAPERTPAEKERSVDTSARARGYQYAEASDSKELTTATTADPEATSKPASQSPAGLILRR